MDLHPNLEPLAGLIGTWHGSGHGEYPTIASFDYTEELVFADIGKPFLTYRQRTWSPEGLPLHTETGFVRVPTPDRVEFILAQPTGQTELAEGELVATATGLTIGLIARIDNSTTAKHVDQTRRRYELDGDHLSVEFGMAAVGLSMTHHLASRLGHTGVGRTDTERE